MLRDDKGHKLFRHVDVKVHFPDGIPTQKIHQKAPPHKGFTEDNIDDLLMSVADQLETLYPWWTFRMVELASKTPRTAEFSFVCQGLNPDFKPTPVAAPAPSTPPLLGGM